ncbi:cell division cycle protein 123 [Anaeramoeba flamelloides]|uniref:Cell division cycle protein 123 n=1 Tax=Anaeramoeba flamelloides TaxID=1746091 RepID=A0AAV7ZS41_9EUKA|nr:cell division cycle protein 123 [Anaeramoeba flamelloides]
MGIMNFFITGLPLKKGLYEELFKDALWMNSTGDLKCIIPSDIYSVLKGSDLIIFDLNHAFDLCKNKSKNRTEKFYLILRKLYPLKISQEFRCFCKNGLLFAISQQDDSTYYKYLEKKKEYFFELIKKFWNAKIKEKFGSKNYIFDIYITKNDKIFLIDFNIYSRATEPLLFDWDELNEIDLINKEENKIQFRLTPKDKPIKPNLSMTSRLSYDLQEFGNNISAREIVELIKKGKFDDKNEDEDKREKEKENENEDEDEKEKEKEKEKENEKENEKLDEGEEKEKEKEKEKENENKNEKKESVINDQTTKEETETEIGKGKEKEKKNINENDIENKKESDHEKVKN